MQIELIFKVAAVGILISVLNQVLKASGREDQASLTVLAGLVVVLMILLQEVKNLFDFAQNLFGL